MDHPTQGLKTISQVERPCGFRIAMGVNAATKTGKGDLLYKKPAFERKSLIFITNLDHEPSALNVAVYHPFTKD